MSEVHITIMIRPSLEDGTSIGAYDDLYLNTPTIISVVQHLALSVIDLELDSRSDNLGNKLFLILFVLGILDTTHPVVKFAPGRIVQGSL